MIRAFFCERLVMRTYAVFWKKQEKQEDKLEKQIVALLPGKQADIFNAIIKNHIVHVTNKKDKSGFVLRFSKDDAVRWICKQAHDFGWTKELFEDAEQ